MTTPADYFRIKAYPGGSWLAPSLGTFPGARQESGYVVTYPEATGSTGVGIPTGAFGYLEHTLRFPDGLTATDYNYMLSVFGGVSKDTPYVEIEIELLDPREAPLPGWETWRGYAYWPTVRSIVAGLIYNGVEMKTVLVERT